MVGQLIATFLALAQPPPAQPPPAQSPPAPAAQAAPPPAVTASAPVADLEQRLARLGPDSPRQYFELAEEVAAEIDAFPNPADARRLARELFALSYELDHARGRSACLALASLTTVEAEQRWLWALASGLDPRTPGPGWSAVRTSETAESVALDVCAVLGYARAGEGRRAEQLLARPGVTELLERYEALLSPAGLRGGADAIRRQIARWPVCPECKNRRVVVRGSGESAQAVLCRTCAGRPGSRLSVDDLLLQLRLESALLNGIHRSWAAQALADRGAPLRDPDPSEIGPTFGVSAARPYWRSGAWAGPDSDSTSSAPPSSSPSPPAETPE